MLAVSSNISTLQDQIETVLAIVNSDILFDRVAPFMSKGQFGARDLQKHLWKLPIPQFNTANPLHAEVSEAGQAATELVEEQLEQLGHERDRVTVTIARREIRKCLRESDAGKAVEAAVRQLLDPR